MQLNNILEKLSSKNMDAMVVLKPENITYLTGFKPSSFSVLLLKDDPVLFISKMDFEDVPPNLNFSVEEFTSLSNLNGFLNEKMTFLGVENSIPLGVCKKIRNDFKIKITDVIDTFRRIKSKKEIKCIKKAINIAENAFKNTQLEGSDNVVAAELNYNMMVGGSLKPAFETIVASGTVSSKPHANIQQKSLENPVLMDWGAVYNNYCSDISRTRVETEKQHEILSIVIEAQKEAIKIIKPGIKASYVDKIARDVIADYGYGDNFIHSTGHGLGMEVHEGPSLSKREELKIEKGMVLTVEPGIYIEGEFGVRIEDDILVKNRAKVLTKLNKMI
ncbi:MAG: aminopeptidase [Methanobacterium sp. BRmetb2]|jgi:Xaa-Pro dipeptidase|nr:MAG: aminopeptidase [Methanobacterium sp. BRmetb2]